MSTVLETVDANGNIAFSQGEGVDVRIIERDEITGAAIDLSAEARLFTIYGSSTIVIQPIVDPDLATGLQVLVTEDQLNSVYSTSRFSYTDEAEPVPIILWEGNIFRRIP